MRKSFFYLPGIAIFVISLLFFLGTGCQRDLEDPNGNGDVNPVVNDNITVVAGVRGIVIDENGQPVAGANVTSGTASTTTDRYGVFRFRNINLSKANGAVKVIKTGYFTAIKTFVTTAGRTHQVRIRLIKKTNTGNFTASAGGTITFSGGGKLVVPADAITDMSGNAYSGIVNVVMTWIDPSASNLAELVPGDLRGITTGGEERGLSTYGMIGVELTSSSGQSLKIAAGKTAELSFPIPSSLSGSAPATIDLWYFDEASSRWKQEGTATKTGSNYVAQVSHFSFWNCDAPFPLVNLCMRIVDAATSAPLNNVEVRIRRSNGTYGYGITDSAGNLCGAIPKNEILTLEVLDQCHNSVYTQNIGPFSSNTSLGTISITLPPTHSLTITGIVVDCVNANVTNGSAIIYTGGAYSYEVPVTNGNFSLTILRCASTQINFSVTGVDNNTVQQGVPVSGSGTNGTVNIGTIQACGSSSAQYVEYFIDGTPYNFASPPDNFGCGDSVTTLVPGYTYINTTGGYHPNPAVGGSFNFSFFHNLTTGTLPLNFAGIWISVALQSTQIVSASPAVNITRIDPAPGFQEGNFNIVMNFPSLGPKNVQCNFRVRRN